MRCPEELTGRNSVRPWTTARTRICRNDKRLIPQHVQALIASRFPRCARQILVPLWNQYLPNLTLESEMELQSECHIDIMSQKLTYISDSDRDLPPAHVGLFDKGSEGSRRIGHNLLIENALGGAPDGRQDAAIRQAGARHAAEAGGRRPAAPTSARSSTSTSRRKPPRSPAAAPNAACRSVRCIARSITTSPTG